MSSWDVSTSASHDAQAGDGVERATWGATAVPRATTHQSKRTSTTHKAQTTHESVVAEYESKAADTHVAGCLAASLLVSAAREATIRAAVRVSA
jgi:hypothetical protein